MTYKAFKVIVTGGAGFIGSAAIWRLNLVDGKSSCSHTD